MRLLVSVQNESEFRQVQKFEPNIIDLKSPPNGSLGKPDSKTIQQIAQIRTPPTTQKSLALGELADVDKPPQTVFDSIAEFDYVKFGLSGIKAKNWRTIWNKKMAWFPIEPERVPVVFADYRICEAPTPMDVLRFAAAIKLKTVLMDTFSKTNNTNLFTHQSVAELIEFVSTANALGLRIALAGSLRFDHISTLREIAPDWVGVRGAICEGIERKNRIDPREVERWVGELNSYKKTVLKSEREFS